MKAIITTKYGSPEVLEIGAVEKPTPKSKEVLIRIHSVSVNYGDLVARNFKNISAKEFNMPFLFWLIAKLSFGLHQPKVKILGSTFSGEIDTIGKEVTKFKKGEKVFGYIGEKMGAYAEYLCMPENGILATKPTTMTFEEASAVPYGAIMALNLLKKVNLLKGQKVVVVGASGAIGSAAVQLAKHHFGAEVIGVCGASSLEFVKEIGADKVIDYRKEDFTNSGETYDLIVDVLGKGSFSSYKASLKKNGIYLSVSFKSKKLFQMLWTSITGGKKMVCALAIPKPEDLIFIKELAEDGKIKSIIDKSFPMAQAAAAHRYMESGMKRGNVVITI